MSTIADDDRPRPQRRPWPWPHHAHRAGRRILTAVLLTSATAASVAQEWTEIDASEARLASVLPELARLPDQDARTRKARQATQEIVTWRRSDRSIAAQIFMMQLQPFANSIFTDDQVPPIAEQVVNDLPGATPGETGPAENAIGAGERVMFFMSGRQCVFFRVYDGWRPPDGALSGARSANMLGKTMVLGWYCAKHAHALSLPQAHTFIRSVGIRGFAMPDPQAAKAEDVLVPSTGQLCDDGASSVGLLSMHISGASYLEPNPTDKLLDNVRQALGPGSGCSLDYDFARTSNARRFGLAESRLWTGSIVDRKPDSGQVAPALRNAGLDVGVMVFVQVGGHGYSQHNSRTVVYAVEARTGEVVHGVNRSRDFNESAPALTAALSAMRE